MCEECEGDGTMAQSYAQKRARMRTYWTPKRKAAGFTTAEATPAVETPAPDKPKAA